MLDLSTAVLCDFAQVRDRLLFVSSGAVSRLYRRDLPSPLGLMVGLVIEVPLEDSGVEHTLRADVVNRHGDALATVQNTFRVGDEGLFPHEVQQVPLVLSITGVRARTWGTHQVRLTLDDELMRALTLYIVPAAGVTPARTVTPRPQAAGSAPSATPVAEPAAATDDTPEPDDTIIEDDTVIEMVDGDDADDAGPPDEEVVVSVGEAADAIADDTGEPTADDEPHASPEATDPSEATGEDAEVAPEADEPETTVDDDAEAVAAAGDAVETADAAPVAEASDEHDEHDEHDDDSFVLVDDDHHDESDMAAETADPADPADETDDADDTEDEEGDEDSPSASDDGAATPAFPGGRRGRRGRRRK